jgi:hypothetical protein
MLRPGFGNIMMADDGLSKLTNSKGLSIHMLHGTALVSVQSHSAGMQIATLGGRLF